ncbi:unnamed protein product [Rotaria socialis]|nr:unnamed protein product [Rotaria socialis]CAF3375831.1 unnamed protein product [Rotaria socialis]CAF3461232.1 unnamed protein product [Rotaria socialis]CAF3728700.1 unnamed protein product [Rotaria socialis]CAF3762570.1 unnamed protein product [Rotaria socialis]
MPRGQRPKPSTTLVSEEILKEIKSVRPLRLFINKEKRKGIADNPFTLRVKFCQLPKDKQARYLQKSVDKYIQLLDEKDVDESVQIECKLFDYLLMKGEQKKYFESINAPPKPPGTAVPYYNQIVKQETDDDSEPAWKSLSTSEKQNYKRRRKEAKAEYLSQVRNFANDLPERLRTDFLLFAEPSPTNRQIAHTSFINDYDDIISSATIRQRRKSLTALPESLQPSTITTTTVDNQPKLSRGQLNIIHQCIPSVLYYETNVSDNDKPTFTRTMTKNAYIRSMFNQIDESERIKYILKSVKKWSEFLQSNPSIIENQIATLHLLLVKNEDIVAYFSAVGLPQRPPTTSYLLYNYERVEAGSQTSWTDLSPTQRDDYTQRLIDLKNDYYQKLIHFVDNVLPSNHMRYEFFRNVKFAMKDYELANRYRTSENITEPMNFVESYLQKISKSNDINQFNQIKAQLLATELTNEQKQLIEDLTELMHKHMQ